MGTQDSLQKSNETYIGEEYVSTNYYDDEGEKSIEETHTPLMMGSFASMESNCE